MYVCIYLFALFFPKVTLVCHRTAHAQGTPTQATVNDGTDDSWSEIGCIVVRCCTETTMIFRWGGLSCKSVKNTPRMGRRRRGSTIPLSISLPPIVPNVSKLANDF